MPPGKIGIENDDLAPPRQRRGLRSAQQVDLALLHARGSGSSIVTGTHSTASSASPSSVLTASAICWQSATEYPAGLPDSSR